MPLAKIFKNDTWFAILFISVLLTDVAVKLNEIGYNLRYITKPAVLLILMAYCFYHKTKFTAKRFRWIIIGLICFLMGDFFNINHHNETLLLVSVFLFIFGKFSYSIVFSHNKDFKMSKLIPYSILVFGYTVLLFMLMLDRLDGFFYPSLVFFFMSMLCSLFAYLRRGVVNELSYWLVFIGILSFIAGESLVGLKMFYGPLPFQDFGAMFFYGFAQYLIIIGLVKETPILKPVNA